MRHLVSVSISFRSSGESSRNRNVCEGELYNNWNGVGTFYARADEWSHPM